MEEKFGTSPLCFPCMQMLAGREVRPEKGENINKKGETETGLDSNKGGFLKLYQQEKCTIRPGH